MSRKLSTDRKIAIYKNWQETQNMAETGRIFNVTREYVRQVVNKFLAKDGQV